MWTNPPGSKTLQERLEKFSPPYCPNFNCTFHDPEHRDGATFRIHSRRSVQRFPYLVIRYRCTNCRRTFSSSFFTLSYRDKCNDFYERIDALRRNGASKRGIAKLINCNEDTIRRKLKKIARWTILRLAKDSENLSIDEPIAFDGLENFAGSQYSPNNVNHAVGKQSYFIYDFNLSTMNRKGKMSLRQKRKKKLLEGKHGRFPSCAILDDSKRIFERLLKRTGVQGLHLHTDNHFLYRRAIRKIENNQNLFHYVTPAKVARNFRNRLFPINHTDLLTRQQLADFKRETIAFSKTSVAMLESFVIFAGFKNYRRERFLKPHRSDPKAHLESPAMYLKLTDRVLRFNEMFDERITAHQVQLNSDWKSLFQSIDLISRERIRNYNGI